MPYCQNCGSETNGNFCPNCGTQTGTFVVSAPQFILHKDADVKPRYSIGAIILAGWPGLGVTLLTLVLLSSLFTKTFNSISDFLSSFSSFVFCIVLLVLCYLPGIISIRKRSPEGMFAKTFFSFWIRSVLFIFFWGVAIAGCAYIVGIFCKSWRLGLWVSRPGPTEYTVFVDGEKIPVVRLYDNLPDYGPRGEYVYQDANGEFYRPPVR